ncbi:MAG: SRPBCC domain-containing protein, partial [Solirubrobacterales bacterium]|nr:SRPBCC domain-containing protein [Solirubrobacterales bacterium]
MSDRAVTRTIVVPAPQGETWDALVDPDRLEDWFADTVEADELAPDAEVSFRWDDGERREAVIEEVDAPNRLTFRWRDVEGEESHVAFRLDEHEAGTRVTVVESGLTA